MTSTDIKVVVVGAGIIGLSTAISLLNLNKFTVTIVAEYFPGDNPNNGKYASPSAGAHWRSDAPPHDLQQQAFDKATFNHFWKLANDNSSETGVIIVDGYEYYDQPPPNWKDPWFKDICPQYRRLEDHELPEGVQLGIGYQTVTINPQKHLEYLRKQFLALGGKLQKKKLSHIKEAIFQGTDIVVICTGLGSSNLGGVEDCEVRPGQGQVVVIQFDDDYVNYTFTRYSREWSRPNDHSGSITYVIPRDNGEVILGGTYVLDEFSTRPDENITQDIIERCVQTDPKLKNYKINKVVVCLRPFRVKGPNYEMKWIENEGKKILLCHNFGHGGFGWQCSFGAAQYVVNAIMNNFTTLIEN